MKCSGCLLVLDELHYPLGSCFRTAKIFQVTELFGQSFSTDLKIEVWYRDGLDAGPIDRLAWSGTG